MLNLSKIFIAGKIQNYKSILQRFLRDYGTNDSILNAVRLLTISKNNAIEASDADILRGIEGDAANTYYSVFSLLILNQKEDFTFTGRNRRPPKDAVNALLSFAYTLIANDCAAALETIGLDPYMGYLHTLRPGRTSLALDIMEEMRAYLGDRFVLSLINRKQLNINDFISQGDLGVIMTDSAKKTFIAAWQNRKKEIITHPFLNEKMPIGLLPYIQSMLLARYIRGDIDNYPVFIIK